MARKSFIVALAAFLASTWPGALQAQELADGVQQVPLAAGLSLRVERSVGQLDFGDFLASVSLNLGQGNVGNVELVPEQSWEARLEATRNLGRCCSARHKTFQSSRSSISA